MRDKLDPKIERQRQFHAFEVWRDLGHGRTFREVARQVDAAPTTISKWATLYKWDERLKQYNVTIAEKEEAGDLLDINDPMARKLVDMMGKVEAIIDSAFTKDIYGKRVSLISITSPEELTKIIAEYRKFLETYHRFVSAHLPDSKNKDRAMKINEFNVFMGKLSQQERINVVKGLANGDVPGRDKQPAGGIQDADFEQVSGRGNEDGSGCEGVSGSSTGSSSGDEGTVRES